MASDLRSRLIAAGADKLADALLELAERCGDAADAVDRIGASAEDNLARFRAKLDDLKSSDRSYNWRQSEKLAGRLQAMLQDLEAADPDPRTGVELMIKFLATDAAAMESCDDSSGWVGDVFTRDGCETFARFARQIDDVDFVTDLLVGHLTEDEYGLRLDLVDHASDFLAKPGLELLVGKLSRRAEEARTDTPRILDLRAIESLALQLGDPALFEGTRLAARPISTAGDAVDIAAAYLKSGQPGNAIDWLQRFDDAVWKHQDDDRDRLLLAAYIALDDRPSATEVAWRRFHSFRDQETLDELIRLIGEEQREFVISDEARAIAETLRLSLSDADFLIQCRRMDEAESYILDRADQLPDFGYHS